MPINSKFATSIQLLFLTCLILSGFWYIGSALTGVLLIIAAVFGCVGAFNRHTFQSYSLSKLMLIYLVWLYVVALSSSVPNTSMMTLAVLAGLPVMYLVASNTPNFAEIWKSLRVVIFVTAVGLALWAIWQVENHIGYGWAVGPLVDRNAFAALMNLLWFPAAYLFISNEFASKRWVLLLLGGGLFIINMALFATSSRGGIVTWLLLLPFILWASYLYTKSKQLIAIVLGIALFAYFCSAQFLHSNVADRTFQIGPSTQAGQLSKDVSTNVRLLIWQSTIKIALNHPFTGTGWGTFEAYYPTYRSPLENSSSGVVAHNDYVQLPAEGGIPALLLQLSIVLGLLLQLRKSLKRASEDAGFESTALLLGCLAIFIHAAVNFIFVFAFMNIMVGLYLARAVQLIDTPQSVKISSFEQIRPSVKRLLAGFIILMVSTPFALHLFAQAFLAGSQPGLKAINLVAPKVTVYSIANFITTIRPQEGIAQEAMLQTAEQFLAVSANNNSPVTDDFKHELLNETIERYESARARSANNPNMGVREVKMLIAYHDMLGGDIAYTKAQQILSSSLKTDPYHAQSMIMLARLQVAEGQRSEAIRTLQYAENHVRTQRDQQLIVVETLRQLAAPKKIAELDDIEKQLGLVHSDSETGRPLILPPNFNENINAKLKAIAGQLKQAQ